MFGKNNANNSNTTTPEVRKDIRDNSEATMATRNVNGASASILGSDISIKGDIIAGADLRIDGKVEGDIACVSIIQGESSQISGNVKAESARLAGLVQGSISARELIVLKTAHIQGDVHYDALTIEQGAQVEGRFSPRAMGSGALPASSSSSSEGEEPLLTLASFNEVSN